MHLAPAGITLQELIDEYCGGMLDGHTLYGYLPGGASGGILPASMANIPLDFDTLTPVRLLHRLGRDRRALGARQRGGGRAQRDEVLRRGIVRPVHAVPVGTVKALQLMQARRWDAPLLQELSQAMMDASICGLGQAAPNPVLSVLKYFPEGSEG